ncbi:hypothetical protein ACVIQY_000258 [Bradyrhizobium sp. USDA 3051]
MERLISATIAAGLISAKVLKNPVQTGGSSTPSGAARLGQRSAKGHAVSGRIKQLR